MREPRDTSAPRDSGFARKILNGLILHRKLFWVTTVVILVADLWTKDAVISFVRDRNGGRPYWVVESCFALVDVQNRGGPWEARFLF